MDTIDSQFATATINKNMADFILSRSKLKDTGEIFTTPSSSSGVLTLDYSTGNHFNVTLTENVTSILWTNCAPSGCLTYSTVRFNQNGTGGYTVAWPSLIKNTTPTVTATASRSDAFALFSWDSGTTATINTLFQNVASLG
jgi:hypothetical protein